MHAALQEILVKKTNKDKHKLTGTFVGAGRNYVLLFCTKFREIYSKEESREQFKIIFEGDRPEKGLKI